MQDIDEIKRERDVLEDEINEKIRAFIDKYKIELDIEHYNTSNYETDAHYIRLKIKV